MTRKVLSLTILAAYFHALMEWLFFATTPSSLSTLTFFESLKVFFITGGVISILLISALLILSIPAKRWEWLVYLPATFMLSVTALILLDNFTYTVFKFGIVSTPNAWRVIYLLILIVFFYWTFRFITRQKIGTTTNYVSLSLFAISSALISTSYFSRDVPFNILDTLSNQSNNNHPNIIILGADGLSVSYLSAYGFNEETTPFISELLKTSLVAENVFPNASSTTASTTSALTGKDPAEVKVYRYPDILSGEDSYQHLPALLKDLGYHTVQIGTPSYVDALKVNLADGFEVVNGREIHQPALDLLSSILGNTPSTYFIQLVGQRVSERLLHIFFIRDMDNPIQQVNNPTARLSDEERLAQIINLMQTSSEPVFVFAHFMGTHGPHFSTEELPPTDESLEDEEEWDVELYKQAIRDFDHHVEMLFQYLTTSGKIEDTVVVIYTDHGYRYAVNRRTPLIFHFPKNEYTGIRKNNVQVIDIPATLVDYLEIPQPTWMMGTSILKEEASPTREIISITAGSPRKIAPPFYQIKTVQIIICQKWYSLNVQENIWRTGDISGHTASCDEALLPAETDILERIVDYLRNYRYDVSSIE